MNRFSVLMCRRRLNDGTGRCSVCEGKMDTVSAVVHEQRSDDAHTVGNWLELPFPFGHCTDSTPDSPGLRITM